MALQKSVFQIFLTLGLLVGGSCQAFSQTQPFLISKLLKPANDKPYARKGLLGSEGTTEWSERIMDAPLNIERLFMRWSPDNSRTDDFALIVCFDRTLQDVELHSFNPRKIEVKITFNDRTEVVADLKSLMSTEYEIRNRCAELKERSWHKHVRHSGYELLLPNELRFRPEGISKVELFLTRPSKYGRPPVVYRSEATQVIGFVAPFWTSYKGSRPKEHPVTAALVKGRIEGEAWKLSKECPEIKMLYVVAPPQDNDRSDYAIGFEFGQSAASSLLSMKGRCADAQKAFGIPISQIGPPFAK
jgi:hypothetical protein